MNNHFIKTILFIFIVSWSTLAISEQTESAAQEADTQEKADESAIFGQGWKLIRSPEMGNSGKFVHMVLVDLDKEMDKTVYSAAINRLCGKVTDFCRIRFWTQERFIPEKVTPTPEQLKAQKADYLFNPTAGVKKTTWSCKVDHDKSHCVNY